MRCFPSIKTQDRQGDKWIQKVITHYRKLFLTFVLVKLKNTYPWFKGAASLLLLFGYFLNVVSFQSFHHAAHYHHHSELHTEEAEADACHRAIFHGETSHDCAHKGHITEVHDHCKLCKVTVSRFHYASNITQSVAQTFAYKTYQLSSIDVADLGHPYSFSPRGPPAFS